MGQREVGRFTCTVKKYGESVGRPQLTLGRPFPPFGINRLRNEASHLVGCRSSFPAFKAYTRSRYHIPISRYNPTFLSHVPVPHSVEVP